MRLRDLLGHDVGQIEGLVAVLSELLAFRTRTPARRIRGIQRDHVRRGIIVQFLLGIRNDRLLEARVGHAELRRPAFPLYEREVFRVVYKRPLESRHLWDGMPPVQDSDLQRFAHSVPFLPGQEYLPRVGIASLAALSKAVEPDVPRPQGGPAGLVEGEAKRRRFGNDLPGGTHEEPPTAQQLQETIHRV